MRNYQRRRRRTRTTTAAEKRATAFPARAQRSRTCKAEVALILGRSTPPSPASPQAVVRGVEAHATGAGPPCWKRRSFYAVMQTPHGRGTGLRAVIQVADAPRARTRQQPPPCDCRPCRAAPRYAAQLHAVADPQTLYAVANLQRSSTPSSTCKRLSGSSPACEG